MAINLPSASDGRIDYGNISGGGLGGAAAMTIALTIRLTAAPASRRLATQWGNAAAERAYLLSCNASGEVALIVADNVASFYGKVTSGLGMTNGGLYRIVAKVHPASNLGAIWVNGVSQTVVESIASNSLNIGIPNTNLQIGHETDEAVDGQDADYAECGIWREYVPDWMCYAYGIGYAPSFYRKNLHFYAPLHNTSHLRDRASQGFTGTNTAGTNAAHPSMIYPTSGVFSTTFEAAADPLQRVTQLVMLYGYNRYADEDPPPTTDTCSGGGTVASGANPTDGTALATATALHAWIETTIGTTTYRWAKAGINHGNPRTPRVLSFGNLTRALSDDQGGFEGSSMTILLSDHDRTLRGLHATQTLLNQTVSVYVAGEATIRANGNPWRVFRGIVRDFRPESDLKYRISIEDPLTLSMSAFAQERLIPSTLISITDGTADQGLRQTPAPVLYGSLSDEDDDEPIGTIEAPFVGTETPDGEDASLGNLHKHLIGISPCHNVRSVFIGDPLSGAPPTRRARALASDYGTNLYVPHRTGWFESELYSVQDDKRWTFLFVDQNHPGADLARYNRIPITVNVCAREAVGNATGNVIDILPLQFLHVLNNDVAQDVGDENWKAIAVRDGYAIFHTDSFNTVSTRSKQRIAGGYKGAFVLGHSFKQITLREAIKQFCRSGDFDIGVNRHGQIILTMLDRTVTAVSVVFTDQSDILKDSFSINPCLDKVENQVRYAYKRNYLKTLQQLNPEEGSRLPREPFDKDWLSGTVTLDDSTEQGLLGEVRSSPRLELEMVRDASTAADVAAQRLALRKPSNGRAEATFDCTLSKGYNVELGDLITVTHFQGLSSTGWSARRCQVRRHVTDLDRFTVTLTVRDVDNLLGGAAAASAVTIGGADITVDGAIVTIATG